jgi:hypothetical protein
MDPGVRCGFVDLKAQPSLVPTEGSFFDRGLERVAPFRVAVGDCIRMGADQRHMTVCRRGVSLPKVDAFGAVPFAHILLDTASAL